MNFFANTFTIVYSAKKNKKNKKKQKTCMLYKENTMKNNNLLKA